MSIGIMYANISTQSFGNELFFYERANHIFLKIFGKLAWERDDKLPGEPTVFGFFVGLHSVPKYSTILPFFRGVFGKKHLLKNKSFLSGIIVENIIVVIKDTGTTHICRSRDSGTTDTAADDFCFKMVYGDRRSPLFRAVGFLSAFVRAILRVGTLGGKALSADLADMLRVMR